MSDDASVGRKFRLIEKIAERDDVLIYDAEHTGIGRRVELRMLPIGLKADGEEADRLIHAARAGARVSHGYIRSVVDSGVDEDGRPFIVYEPIDGLTVAGFVAQHPGGLELTLAAELCCQLLEALEAAHDGGVVHRQLCADNIAINQPPGVGPQIKIGAFGWAFLENRPQTVPELPRGYSRYFAPELRRGEDTTCKSVDIFAVGVLLRFLLTGDTKPGQGELPDVAARAIERATAPDPDERFQTAGQFLNAVSMILPSRNRPAVSIHPPGMPGEMGLTADLRYLKRRREREMETQEVPSASPDLELLPVLLVIEALYARLGAAGWRQVVASVPEVVELLPDSGRSEQYAAEGVSVSLVSRMLSAADDAGGDGNLALLSAIGEAVAERGLERICPTLPDPLTPAALVDCVPALWRSLCRQGTVAHLERGDRKARVSVRSQRAPTLELYGAFAGILRGALRKATGGSGEVNTPACEALGDAADIFELTW